jgi:hypothetical protein
MKVEDITFEDYKRIAIERRLRFSCYFNNNGLLNEELLYEVYYNATHSMSTGKINDEGDMNAFIVGTLEGCKGSSMDSLISTNNEIRKSEALSNS